MHFKDMIRENAMRAGWSEADADMLAEYTGNPDVADVILTMGITPPGLRALGRDAVINSIINRNIIAKANANAATCETIKDIATGAGWPEGAAIAAAVRFTNERDARAVVGIPNSATVRTDLLQALLFDTTLTQSQVVAQITKLAANDTATTLNTAARTVFAARRREVHA